MIRGGDPCHGELGCQGEVGGAEGGDGVVPGDEVSGGREDVGCGAELVAGGDADVHGDRPGEGVAEVEDAGDPPAVGEQVLAVEVGVDDLYRCLREPWPDVVVEPVQAVGERGAQPARRDGGARGQCL